MCRNALSVVALIALAIASVLGDNSIFKSWISGGSWGCIIVAALAVVFREWETEDESYVILEIGDDDDSDDFNTDGEAEVEVSHGTMRNAGYRQLG